jgi:hypothetical protein
MYLSNFRNECFWTQLSTSSGELSFLPSFPQAYLVCGCLSIVSLSVTLFIYVTLPSLKNLHGRIVVCNVIAILLTTLSLMVVYNVRRSDNIQETAGIENSDDASAAAAAAASR